MPAKFSIKMHKPDMYAHVFNRGANKDPIFLSETDFQFFRFLIKNQLTKNYPSIRLIAFCLLPNHFHLLLYHEEARAISRFMHSIGTSYSMYFNKKYGHSGKLCQGVYKSVPLYSFEKIRATQKYILDNPQKAGYENWDHVGWIV